jgi:hypothetical protein
MPRRTSSMSGSGSLPAAVGMALTSPVSILTGGPGTGKTHSLRAILTLARAKGVRCLLAAPTGRAAKRMEEATRLPSGTLHRVLEIRPGGKAGRALLSRLRDTSSGYRASSRRRNCCSIRILTSVPRSMRAASPINNGAVDAKRGRHRPIDPREARPNESDVVGHHGRSW